MKVSPFAGKAAAPAMLVNVPKLVTAYYTDVPDPDMPEQRVVSGTSGHRGSAFEKAFNEWHILAISQEANTKANATTNTTTTGQSEGASRQKYGERLNSTLDLKQKVKHICPAGGRLNGDQEGSSSREEMEREHALELKSLEGERSTKERNSVPGE